jgi:hypothetical protein
MQIHMQAHPIRIIRFCPFAFLPFCRLADDYWIQRDKKRGEKVKLQGEELARCSPPGILSQELTSYQTGIYILAMPP